MNDILTGATTHLAGPAVLIGARHIQRCLVCGEALINDDLSNMAVADGDNRGPSAWKAGSLVEKEGGNPTRTSLVGELPESFDVKDLPENFCLNLVEV